MIMMSSVNLERVWMATSMAPVVQGLNHDKDFEWNNSAALRSSIDQLSKKNRSTTSSACYVDSLVAAGLVGSDFDDDHYTRTHDHHERHGSAGGEKRKQADESLQKVMCQLLNKFIKKGKYRFTWCTHGPSYVSFRSQSSGDRIDDSLP